jgi:4-methylaminobutanoate oxidase (formaldehyde-forming)
VHLKSKGDFIGRAALEKQKLAGVTRKLSTFVADGMLPVYGGETIMLDGKVVSLASAAAFGHTLQKTIFYGYLPVEIADRTDFTVETFGSIYPIVRVESPLYDPENRKLKA